MRGEGIWGDGQGQRRAQGAQRHAASRWVASSATDGPTSPRLDPGLWQSHAPHAVPLETEHEKQRKNSSVHSRHGSGPRPVPGFFLPMLSHTMGCVVGFPVAFFFFSLSPRKNYSDARGGGVEDGALGLGAAVTVAGVPAAVMAVARRGSVGEPPAPRGTQQGASSIDGEKRNQVCFNKIEGSSVPDHAVLHHGMIPTGGACPWAPPTASPVLLGATIARRSGAFNPPPTIPCRAHLPCAARPPPLLAHPWQSTPLPLPHPH